MNRIGLKVNGIWCVLPQDVSISIEEQNPLFSDSGSFSYPIELSVSQNRELFKSIDHPHGRIRPQDLDGLPFELWFDGVMLLYGSTETDEDLDIDEDKCSVNLVSGNGDFQSKIEGMKCTDVPLMGKVHLGYVIDKMTLHTNWDGDLEAFINTDHTMYYHNVNVSFPYGPSNPYCNARVCVKRTDEYKPNEDVPYWVYDADRPWSGVCFYVAYFLDCLFKHLNITVKENNLGKVQDMTRLAFFTTKCEHETGELLPEDNGISFKDYANFEFNYRDTPVESVTTGVSRVYATNKNFPDTDVRSLLESLFNAFGLRLVEDVKNRTVSIYYIRDILRDNTVEDVNMVVTGKSLSYEKVEGVKVTYGGGDDDTSFNYDDWDQNEVKSDFNDIIRSVAANNETCYISSKTGNKYRIKIDKESVEKGDEKALYPSLVEVSQFSDYVVGKDSNNTDELKISFVPIVENEVVLESLKEQGTMSSQRLAVYVDAEMKKKDDNWIWLSVKHPDGHTSQAGNFRIRYSDPQAFDETGKNPLLSIDSGFTLGIMRGPGNDAAVQIYLENYDGNGNSAWTTVVADYAFTADTMDAYGNHYDYNGKEPGGVELDGRISLKTHIQTAKDLGLKDKEGNDIDWGIDATAAKRGLADRFMSEYMYFLLNRKTVSMDVDTTLSQLTSLSWFKQLRVGDTVGRLKSRSYTLTNSGVSDMSIELYTIN